MKHFSKYTIKKKKKKKKTLEHLLSKKDIQMKQLYFYSFPYKLRFYLRLTKLFFVTRLTKGVVATPLWTWKINPWGMLIWYYGIVIGLLFPYIPKKYKHYMYDVTMT